MATVFVGGSALLLAGAMAALAFGFANGEESLVWTALVASAGAALFLVIAYVISRRELRASSARSSGDVAQGPERETTPPAAGAGTDQAGAQDDREPGAPEAGEGETEGREPHEAPPVRASAGPTATKPSTVNKQAPPSTAAAAKPPSGSDAVVAIPSKKRFHRMDCRYAKSDSAEEMTRAAARRRGFTPCGICKP